MGAASGDLEIQKNETPQHEVRIETPFAVSRYPVTFEEWDFAAEHGCDGFHPHDQGWGRGRHPVINVSWNDAQMYLRWLRERTGKNYRLLSEANGNMRRTGTQTPFCWGASISPDQANYTNSDMGKSPQKTVPVDSYPPNPWGLYQMHGNTWEWVEDCWHADYEGAPEDGTSWTTEDCDQYVLRGGAWNHTPSNLRAAARGSGQASVRGYSASFRIARTLEPLNQASCPSLGTG